MRLGGNIWIFRAWTMSFCQFLFVCKCLSSNDFSLRINIKNINVEKFLNFFFILYLRNITMILEKLKVSLRATSRACFLRPFFFKPVHLSFTRCDKPEVLNRRRLASGFFSNQYCMKMSSNSKPDPSVPTCEFLIFQLTSFDIIWP